MSAKSRFFLSSALGVLAAGALTAGVGCADNETSVFIRTIKAPTLTGSICTFTNEASGNSLTEGYLDLAFKRNYVLAPLIQNNIFSRVDPGANRPEPNTLNIQGFIVEIHEDSPTGRLITGSGVNNPFSVYQTVVVPPGAGAAPGFTTTLVEAIPLQIGELLFQQVCRDRRGITDVTGRTDCVPDYHPEVLSRLILSISAFGRTVGQVSVQTPKFHFPVTVCCGCLRNFPVTATTTTGDAGVPVPGSLNPSCNAAITQSPANCGNYFGQDYPVPCGLCADTLPYVCQPSRHSFSTTLCPPPPRFP